MDGFKGLAGNQPEELLSDEEQERFSHLERELETAEGTIGEALLEISEKRLYREQYGNFEEYLAGRWGLRRSTAYDHIKAARVRLAIGDRELGRSQCVAIAVLPEELWEQVAREAVGQTVEETRRIVGKHKPGPKLVRATGRSAKPKAETASSAVDEDGDQGGAESMTDDLRPRLHEHRQEVEGPRRPRVLDAVARASDVLAELDEDALGEELDDEQQDELDSHVLSIRERLALVHALSPES